MRKILYTLFLFMFIFVPNYVNAEDTEKVNVDSVVVCDYGNSIQYTNKNGVIFGSFIYSGKSCSIRDYSYAKNSCPKYTKVSIPYAMGSGTCTISFSETKKDNYIKINKIIPGCSFKLKSGTSINLSKDNNAWKATSSDGYTVSLDDRIKNMDSCPETMYIWRSGYGAGITYVVSLTGREDAAVDQDDGTNDDNCENAGKGGCLPEGGQGEAVSDICGIFNNEMKDLAKKIIGYIQIGTVFLALILGILDFVGAIGSDKDNAFKEAGTKFLKRLIAVALVFLVPAILGIILNFISVANDCNVDIFG